MTANPERDAIVARYARLNNNGRPQFCAAAGGKIIYPDQTAAVAAARAMEDLDGCHSSTYQCADSRSGHRHLTASKRARS